ncbi:MAG: hypothetical protein HPY55_05740 [Firmicutes bacterium]|nr:hypothetical protein [Bacillota bacterium]
MTGRVDDGIIRPNDLPEDQHRPKGKPVNREARSQKAQLESVHQHGMYKDIKTDISEKTGRQ